MTALFRSRQRAEEFSARVDGSSAGHRPSADPETERLLGVVRTLRTHPGTADAAPRETFVADLRERLMAEAATVLTAQDAEPSLPPRAHGKRERRLVAVATAAVVLGGTAGVATAARSALPGEALYPVKRVIEQVDVRLSTNPEARGQDLLQQAGGRLDEVQDLLAEDSATSTAEVPRTLDVFTTQSREGAHLLLGSYVDTRSAASVAEVRRFAADELDTLADVADSAPAGARSEVRDAARALEDIDRQARAVCASCTDLPDLRLPPSLQVSAEAARALAEVNAAKLDNSHPVVIDASGSNPHTAAPTGPRVGGARRSGGQAGTAAGGTAPLAPVGVPAPAPAADAPAADAPAADAPGARAPAASLPAAPAPVAPAPVPVAPAPAAAAPAVRSTAVPSVGSDPLPALPSRSPTVRVDVNGPHPVAGLDDPGRLAGTLLPDTEAPPKPPSLPRGQ